MSSATDPQALTKPYTHYDVLRLGRRDFGDLSKDDIKAAYRRALLIHHPDKAPNIDSKITLNIRPKDAPTPRYSIDEIIIAYETLSDSIKRAEYDRSLEQRGEYGWKRNGHNGTHHGVENYDLEDLTYDEVKGTWSKSCRCGDEQGYILTESDLEKESQHGEIYVGCRGCSLFIKVQFAVEAT